MSADGTNLRPLIQTPGNERYASIAPTAAASLYRSDVDGDDEIYVAALAGPVAQQAHEQRPVRLRAGLVARRAAARLRARAARRANDASPAYEDVELWTMPASGGDEQRLTANRVPTTGPPGRPTAAARSCSRATSPGSQPDLVMRDADGVERPLTNSRGTAS